MSANAVTYKSLKTFLKNHKSYSLNSYFRRIWEWIPKKIIIYNILGILGMGSNPAPGVSEIRDCEDLWQWTRLEIRLNAFRRSTIPQNNSSSSSSSSSSCFSSKYSLWKYGLLFTCLFVTWNWSRNIVISKVSDIILFIHEQFNTDFGSVRYIILISIRCWTVSEENLRNGK